MRTKEIEKGKAKEQKEAAKRAAKSKVGYLVHETSVEIPVFPYGYRNGIPVPDWVKIPRGVDRAAYIQANLSTDYLPSTPNKAQFKNLYAQLHQHSYPIASHVLQSSREYVSPEIVRDGNIIPKSNNIGTPVTSYRDKDMTDTYHFVRIWDDNKGGRYIDFLRENASGYVLAFRVFVALGQAGAARLCYFTDEPEIAVKLSELFEFVKTGLHSSYSIVKFVKFGKNSMVRAVDRFATVYANPDMKEDFETKLSVHFWLLVLGEAPRSDIFKRRMYQTIFTENEEETAPIGDIYQVCTNSWNYSSKAICLLRLFLLGTVMGAVLMKQRPNKIDSSTPHSSLQEYFAELVTFRRSAQERCVWISGQNIQDVYDLQKQKVDGKYLYGEDAYNRLSDRCISLLMFSELVLGVIMREAPYEKALYLDDYSAKESEKPLVDEADFLKMFASFEEAFKAAGTKKQQNALLLNFLPHSIVFLKRWGYKKHVNSAMPIGEILLWCQRFANWKRKGLSDEAAAKKVISGWNEERLSFTDAPGLEDSLIALVKFIKANRLEDPV